VPINNTYHGIPFSFFSLVLRIAKYFWDPGQNSVLLFTSWPKSMISGAGALRTTVQIMTVSTKEVNGDILHSSADVLKLVNCWVSHFVTTTFLSWKKQPVTKQTICQNRPVFFYRRPYIIHATLIIFTRPRRAELPSHTKASFNYTGDMRLDIFRTFFWYCSGLKYVTNINIILKIINFVLYEIHRN